MATKIIDEICGLTGLECRFVSTEVVYRPYTKIQKENGVFKPIGQGIKKSELGQICNNAPFGENHWIDKMHYCPKRWAVSRYGLLPTGEKEVIKKRKTTPKKKPVSKKPLSKKKG